MNRLTREDVTQLAGTQAEPAVSMYMSFISKSTQQETNRIRLKNLVKEAHTALVDEQGLEPREAEAFMDSVQRLVAHNSFWGEPGAGGLAIFLTADDERTFRLPVSFEEQVIVSDRFYLKPMLSLLARNGRFYILALSMGQINLFEGTQYDMQELPLDDDVPQSLEEAMQWDDPEQRLQWHTSTDSISGRPAVFHGHSAGSDETKKENILRYFQQVDAGLQSILRDEEAPLVLAAIDYLLPLYQEANSYKQLLDSALKIDPQSLSVKELHERAWNEILEPYFAQSQDAAATHFKELAETDRASADLAEVVRAAHYGQIDVLFAAKDQEQWGAFDEAKNQVALHDDADAGDYDLIDLAAVQTLLHSGTVYLVEQEDMPQQQPVAAIFRYPAVA